MQTEKTTCGSAPRLGLNRFDPSRREILQFHHDPLVPHSLANDRINTLMEDRLGAVWIGTDQGLDLFVPDSKRFVHYLPTPAQTDAPSNEVRAIAENAQGQLWIATQGGLFLFDPQSGYFERISFQADPSPAKKAIATVQVDDSGSLWLGTWISGAYRYDPQLARFDHFFHDPDDLSSLFYDTVYAFAEDLDGKLWVGTAGGGINRYEATTRTFTHFRHDPQDPSSLGSDSVRCLEFDRQGALWIGTRDRGLDRLTPTNGRFTHYRHDPEDRHSLRHDQVLSLTEDRTGELWIGTKAGLDRFDRTRDSFEHHHLLPATSPLANDLAVMAIIEDRDGMLWVGTRSGLFRYDGERDGERATHYAHHAADPGSLSHDFVLSILEDSTGILWIGTGGGGLNRFDPKSETFTRITAADGLGNNVVNGILEDNLNRLWISTNRGLARLHLKDGRWNHYDRRDGLQDTEFNVGAALRGRDGMMYFGGIGGMNAFRPEQFIEDNPYVPPVVLTAFEVPQRGALLPHPVVRVGKPVELNYNENFFSFEFAALNYTRPDKNHYSYRLMDFDHDWVDSGPRRFANYTNVPPGEYTFRVRGSNNEGVWNEVGASLRLRITPPWWRTWWFYTLCVLAAASVLGGAVWSQRNKLHRERATAARERAIRADLEVKNTELERFVYTVSHDLKNPLVTIRNYLGLVRYKMPPEDEKPLESDFDRIDRAAARMHQMLEELVELSRIGRVIHQPQVVPLAQLAHEAAEMLASGIDRAGVDLVIDDDLPAGSRRCSAGPGGLPEPA